MNYAIYAVKKRFATTTASDKQAVQNSCDLSILNYKRVPAEMSMWRRPRKLTPKT